MQLESYPYLEQLLGAYFHQDCYAEGATDDDIIEDFRKTSHEYQRAGVRADISRLLHQHGDDLMDVVDQVLQPSIIIGETKAEAQAWLLKVASALQS
jgi:hypothetical protein